MVAVKKKVVKQIVEEVSLLDPLEQQILLTKLRVKRLSETGTDVISDPPKNLKTPTMKQIDKWKHDSRKKS